MAAVEPMILRRERAAEGGSVERSDGGSLQDRIVVRETRQAETVQETERVRVPKAAKRPTPPRTARPTNSQETCCGESLPAVDTAEEVTMVGGKKSKLATAATKVFAMLERICERIE